VPNREPLSGRVVALTGADSSLGAALGRAMTAAGARVEAIAAGQQFGGADALVHAAIEPLALEPVAFADVDDARWEAVWERTMLGTIRCFQAGFAAMRDRGGRIVAVIPTLSLYGAAGLAPLSAAAEGQRLLVKSAARQWGAHGITVNCVAVAPDLVVEQMSSKPVTLALPALGGPGTAADVASLVVFLASDESRFVTGQTICADGGTWMGAP
jgi:NAD(P)-dependent dehydrogenase (short-subunit alcohol dehydrogenase family)